MSSYPILIKKRFSVEQIFLSEEKKLAWAWDQKLSGNEHKKCLSRSNLKLFLSRPVSETSFKIDRAYLDSNFSARTLFFWLTQGSWIQQGAGKLAGVEKPTPKAGEKLPFLIENFDRRSKSS